MAKYKVGDVVSIEFPFSDLQGQKRRPGLVLVSFRAPRTPQRVPKYRGTQHYHSDSISW